MFNKKNKNNIVTIIDIGSIKIVCLIAIMQDNGDYQIISSSYCKSKGFRAGVITNRKLLQNSILTALESAEQSAEVRVEKAYIIFSSDKVKSVIVDSDIQLKGSVITAANIKNLTEYTIENFNIKDHEIINFNPVTYSIDNIKGIENPEGLFGHKLKLMMQITVLPTSIVYNMINCIADCQIDIEEIDLSAISSSYSCLNEDEKKIGAILLDIGGACASFAYYHNSKLLYSGSVPFGGDNITNDIAKTLSISLKSAERAKILYGSSLISFADSHKLLELAINDNDESEICNVSNAKLNQIIASRIEEIFELINDCMLKKNNFQNHSDYRVVLTGGTSLLPGIENIAGNIFKAKIRLAKPAKIENLHKVADMVVFAASLGMLKKISQKVNNNFYIKDKNNPKSYLGAIIEWFKESF